MMLFAVLLLCGMSHFFLPFNGGLVCAEFRALYLNQFADTPVEKLPRSLQKVVRDQVIHTDSEHHCCAVNDMKTVSRKVSYTRYIPAAHRGYSLETYSKPCGLFNWGRCAAYRSISNTYYNSRRLTSYRTEYYQIPIECPDNKIRCCHGYTLIANTCISDTVLSNVTLDKNDLLDVFGK